ncbi:hypothetical protein [Falsirhodobacter algicola]|uniref:Uncharacterized protein n=1 Tax=Falsirhodobacter algicola TaxID=2692330 RepID=A0A8J8SK55_9RHOB|nr:hypothetical protein [Falsirhodobacter algicola]QUS35039.1 hypothetical protein GR316_01365 [Falsirhodobacter algicola]
MIPKPDHPERLRSLWVAVRCAACALLAAAWALSLRAPLPVGWENGPLESAQVGVLLAGMIAALLLCRVGEGPSRRLWIAAAILWALLAAREMSWGAVFLDPIAMTDHGPSFSSSQLAYRPAVTPVVAALLLGAVIAFVMAGPRRIWTRVRQTRRLPLLDGLGVVAAMLLSTAAERHMGLSLGGWPGDPQILEEGVELAAYAFLLSAQFRIAEGLALPV